MNSKKMIMFMLLFTLTLGFRLINDARWNISESDPTIWIKFCDSYLERGFGDNTVSVGDELDGQTPTVTQALQTIINDFNNVNSSYLRLALYPTDPSNPGDPEEGDSTFTTSKAKQRTIDICLEDFTNPFVGGEAKYETDGDQVTGCEIVLEENILSNLQDFVSTITHEVGHCVGLGHPMETTHAIMSYFADSDVLRLQIDDKMGLVHIYPKSNVDLKEEDSLGLSCSFK